MVVGPRVLDPTNIAWLEQADPALNYLSWLFFRNSEWTFPIGLNPDYGLELSSSIVYGDSNPLLAILFKPLSSFLPETFQYLGIWILACFLLQAWFSWKLMSLVSDSTVIRVLGTGFFVFSPTMLFRVHGPFNIGHFNIAGHFLIIAALYVLFDKKLQRRTLVWGILVGASALVHAYFLPMVVLIWIADIAGKYIDNRLSIRQMLFESGVILAVIGIVCWQAGYFTTGNRILAAGFGYYRMNLLSIIDPDGWSYILKDIPKGAGDYEGFNFMGLGVLFLFVCTLPAMVDGKVMVLWRSLAAYPILFIVLIALTIFAASNKVAIGSFEFSYYLPEYAIEMANILRSSGRMFWPVFYVILFAVAYLVIRSYKRRTAIVLLSMGLFIQIFDTHAGWADIRKMLMVEPSTEWNTPLASPFWEEAASKYTKLRRIQPGNHLAHWRTLGVYAGKHGLSTDAIRLARVGSSALGKARAKASEALRTGRYDADSLYILDENSVIQAALNLNADTDLLARIDGFTVLAPGWKECPDCSKVNSGIELSNLLPEIKTGERMVFSHSSRHLGYLMDGWSHSETWGTWSEGPRSTILLPLPEEEIGSLVIECNPLLNAAHPKQSVVVFINGILIGGIMFTEDSRRFFQVRIPREVLEPDRTDRFLRLEFQFPNAARPVDIGMGDDTRELALGLIAITVQ
uniref:Uncharacterized protein n=1 Tax=Candidatus Kentrum sp. UNK TaxID=2126344 RepID=A0A451AJJ9_9GAMM|nr:MAG: hypothetical protein BECKUNK1418G_GA0071005_108311 [Candidatus Kentron sp. UNK]VFK71825.1 MAG: hypothetical protein BECKUNK1418H_GA0071006_108311 [Candidatus Kentron sp. UNK]